ncbi:MAG: hypothetical protein ACUVTL_02120 [Thermoproteota archaeon]
MRPALVLNLSSVLLKSYLRANRRGSEALTYNQPRTMLLIDVMALALLFAVFQYMLPQIPEEYVAFLDMIAWQAMIALPIFLTSAIIVAGIMFELGQSSGLSSSETVNWLPISPREYVAASAISMVTMYSPLFAISLGVTLPFALRFGFIEIWQIAMAFSALALLLGAFIVEILKASINRVSTMVYRRSGRFGMISRMVLLLLLFIVIQLIFNPYILYYTLGMIVNGVDLIWFIPAIWPSVAIVDLIRGKIVDVVIFSVLSVAFSLLVFEVASYLRQRYWSPTSPSIVIKRSTDYVPNTTALKRFGLSPLEVAVAMKDLRSLIRRKDMARFLTIPALLVITFFLPMIFEPSDYAGRSPGFFLVTLMPFMITLMFSTISIGQEGKDVINLCMLPIPTKSLIKGKLLPSWLISAIGTSVAVVGFQIIAPMNIFAVILTFLAVVFEIIVQGFIGLGIATRYPDFSAGPRSRYVTFTGFLMSFLLGGLATIPIFLPTALYMISSGGVQGIPPTTTFSFAAIFSITIIIGLFLSFLSYRFCKSGMHNLISNLDI